MPSKKKSDNKEEKLARKRELERKRYERIKNNPELYARYKEKNKEKYQTRKQRGLVQSVHNMSQREKRLQRKKWRESSQKWYQRKKEEKARLQRFLNSLSPPESPREFIENIEEPNQALDLDCERERPAIDDINDNLPGCSRQSSRSGSLLSPQNSSASSNVSDSSGSQGAIRRLRYRKDKQINSLRLQLQSVKKVNVALRKQCTRHQQTISSIKTKMPKTFRFAKQHVSSSTNNSLSQQNVCASSDVDQSLINIDNPSADPARSQSIPIMNEVTVEHQDIPDLVSIPPDAPQNLSQQVITRREPEPTRPETLDSLRISCNSREAENSNKNPEPPVSRQCQRTPLVLLSNQYQSIPSTSQCQISGRSTNNTVAQGLLNSYKGVKSHKLKQIISNTLKTHLKTPLINKQLGGKFKSMFRRRNKVVKNVTTAEKKKNVKEFLLDDENSSCTAGKNEYVKKEQQTFQKRYLHDSMGNLYQKFVSLVDYKISFATFCRFRPVWILPASKKPQETCLCTIHENFRLMVYALHRFRIIEPKDPTNLVKTICCNEQDPKCLFRKCEHCKNKVLIYLEFNNSVDFDYWQWRSKTESIIQNGAEKTVRFVKKEKFTVKPKDALKTYENMLEKYLDHCGKMVTQRTSVKRIKEQLKSDEAVIHIDYAENYKCAYSKEIQSAHFAKRQITIHTSVLYFMDSNGQKKSQCFATISSNLRHDSAAVWAHVDPILEYLSNNLPHLSTLHIVSDSAASQYRNYKIYFVITALNWSYPQLKCVTWNYSEAGHGKGAPDGVGAVLKRTADAFVKYGTDVPDFETFSKLLKQKLTNIVIKTISDYNIFEKDVLLPKTLPSFKGTQKVHQIVWDSTKTSCVALRSLSCTEETCLTRAEVCTHGKHFGLHNVTGRQRNIPARSGSRQQQRRMAVDNSHDEPLQTEYSNNMQCSTPARSSSSSKQARRIAVDDFYGEELQTDYNNLNVRNPVESYNLEGSCSDFNHDAEQSEVGVAALSRTIPFLATSELDLPLELQRSTLDSILNHSPYNVTESPLHLEKDLNLYDYDSSDENIF